MALSKKIVHVFLAAVLILATGGITLNKHYCMGRLKSVAVNEHAHGCKGPGMTDPMPCCEDVSEIIIVDELAQSTFDFHFAAVDNFIPALPLYDVSLLPLAQQHVPQHNHAPPPPIDLLIVHQVFRI